MKTYRLNWIENHEVIIEAKNKKEAEEHWGSENYDEKRDSVEIEGNLNIEEISKPKYKHNPHKEDFKEE